MMRSIFAALAVVTVCAAPAAAQDHNVFVNVNFGFQGLKQDVTQSAEFPLYDETATWQAPQSVKGGPTFDLGAGYHLRRNFSVGLAYTARNKHTRNVTLNASIPNPIFTDAFRSASTDVTGLEHSEQQVHLQALWRVPVTVEFDVTLFGGPSFFRVKEDLLENVSFAESADLSSVSVENVGISRQRESAVGFNLGIDTRYMFLRRAGVGAMLRYSHGSVDLSDPSGGSAGPLTIDAGGLEIAGGLRFRF